MWVAFLFNRSSLLRFIATSLMFVYYTGSGYFINGSFRQKNDMLSTVTVQDDDDPTLVCTLWHAAPRSVFLIMVVLESV